jgi:hypothetical protein
MDERQHRGLAELEALQLAYELHAPEPDARSTARTGASERPTVGLRPETSHGTSPLLND